MLFFRLCLWMLLLTVTVQAETRVVGSDLLGLSLASGLENYAQRSDKPVAVTFAGSYSGWRQLQTGGADLSLLTFPPGQELPAPPYVCLPFAFHLAVVLVSESLPLGQLSFPRLAGIFGTTGGPNVLRWSDLDLAGDWAARSVSPYVLDSRASLATATFRHVVLQGGRLKPTVTRHDTLDGLLHGLAQAKGDGIALAAQLPAATRQLKVLPISREEEGVAFSPTPENVFRGDYSLSWPVYLVFRRADARRLFPLLRYLLGEETAKLCNEAGLVPLPAAVRNQQVFDLEQL